jgi:hypothetical protein
VSFDAAISAQCSGVPHVQLLSCYRSRYHQKIPRQTFFGISEAANSLMSGIWLGHLLAQWHGHIFKMALVGIEGSFWDVIHVHSYLMISRLEVYFTEDSGPIGLI